VQVLPAEKVAQVEVHPAAESEYTKVFRQEENAHILSTGNRISAQASLPAIQEYSKHMYSH
jgi:hypothetical protein